jgi:hypothetical protein
MRLLTISLLAAGVAVGGCNRGDIAAAARTTPAGEAPIGTAGANSARAADSRVEWREITIPAGTHLPIVLETTVGSDISRIEEPVQARLARAVTLHGQTALAEGSRITGVVTDATRSGRVKGRAHVALRFDTLVPRGEDARYRIDTAAVGRTAPATKKKDALEIGAPAAGGALVGALLGGKKGALVGTAVGGGAGTAVVLSTRGKEIHLPKGAALTLQLRQPVTIKVRG